MTSLTSVSQTELTSRRKKLRRQRKMKSLQTSWQIIALFGIVGSLIWFTTLPNWVIRKPEQIAIEGNKLLGKSTIRSLLDIKYPQSLWRLQPQEIAQKLESKAPISQATVIRQLVPPGMTIKLKERQPVAIAQLSAKNSLQSSQVGLLDETGVFLPINIYTSQNPSLQLPTLKIIGYLEEYRPYWPKLYQAISRSPVKIFEIDCSDRANLILKTELGIVHFGAYSPRFSAQLNVLDRMRELPNHLPTSQIAYIDLKNSDNPAIQMLKPSDTIKADGSESEDKP